MREITTVVIHCADTPDGGSNFTSRDIDAWHAARGFRRPEDAVEKFNNSFPYIGYHTVIDIFGTVHYGRGEDEIGEHAVGHNVYSLAVCLLGRSSYTPSQWKALKETVEDYKQRYGDVRIIGHRQVDSRKTCPGFEVGAWVSGGLEPLAGHLIEPPVFAPPSTPLALQL